MVGDKCLRMLKAVGEVFPEAKYQRCTVHFYRDVFSVTPRSKVKLLTKMLKVPRAQESKRTAWGKAKAVSAASSFESKKTRIPSNPCSGVAIARITRRRRAFSDT